MTMRSIKAAYLLTIMMLFAGHLFGQYNFTHEKEIKYQEIQDQGRTGTCWSFATSSFLESELARIYGIDVNVSEMYAVRNIYLEKGRNYLLRQGVAGFSQGALAHDLLRAARTYGLVPEAAYPGKWGDRHDHSELEAGMKGYLDAILKSKPLSDKSDEVLSAMLDIYLGSAPQTFSWQGKEYTPAGFLEKFSLPFDDYIGITSFSHHPWYQPFILEIPDNFSNGAFLNVPLEEMYQATLHAVKNGYTVAWDGDVSEKGFNARKGLAIIPQSTDIESSFERPGKEITADQGARQELFLSLETTDDHLMHIVGLATDQNGTQYFIIKNSWGEIGPYGGLLYMSEDYFKFKTISVHFHKGGLQNDFLKKWGLD